MEPADLAVLLDGLQPMRWPALSLRERAGDLMAALALGLLLAALLLPVLRRMARTRPVAPPRPPRVDPVTEALARLKHADPAAFERLRPRLYRPGGMPDRTELEAMLARAPR